MTFSKVVFGLVLLCVVFGLGFCVSQVLDTRAHAKENLREKPHSVRQKGYTYINPLLECESAEGRLNDTLLPFRSEVEQVVKKEIAAGHAETIAVYFRDLNNGPWFGLNEYEEYIPASLLKIPLMLNFYKLAELYPDILEKKVLFDKNRSFQKMAQRYPPSKTLIPGSEYTIDELIERMIIYSDNEATELLYGDAVSLLQNEGFMKNAPVGIDSDLRYLGDILGEHKEKLSVRNYATFFRILFNASYLDRTLSERALSILARSDFDKGLVLGIPRGTRIAHKFGEAGSTTDSSQLHDCGIIYVPKTPYLLCVMTKGADPTKLPDVIGKISAEVYQQVIIQKKEDGN